MPDILRKTLREPVCQRVSIEEAAGNQRDNSIEELDFN